MLAGDVPQPSAPYANGERIFAGADSYISCDSCSDRMSWLKALNGRALCRACYEKALKSGVRAGHGGNIP
jgi:hypothetical protein